MCPVRIPHRARRVAACRNASAADAEMRGVGVVVEFNARVTVGVCNHIRVPVEGAAVVNIAMNGAVRILGLKKSMEGE